MQKKIWIRKNISLLEQIIFSLSSIIIILTIWFILTAATTSEKRIISRNILPNPIEILQSLFSLIKGSQSPTEFKWKQSLFYAIWLSLSRELIAFIIVIVIAFPIGIFSGVNNKIKAFFMPSIIIGTFIPIAALIPLTQAIFGIGELQKVIFLALGMFFVLVALIIKEIDEVDEIYLHTAYTLGYSQFQTVFLIIFPIALPKIWKHLSAVFGLGWGYIIFAEMINTSGGEIVNGIGWLFIARQRRFQIADMYAIFFIIIFFAFLFSYLFKLIGYLIFKYERDI